MFKQRKNKSFTYKPRFQDSEEATFKEGLELNRSSLKKSTKHRGIQSNSLIVLIVLLVAIFVFYYILEGYIK